MLSKLLQAGIRARSWVKYRMREQQRSVVVRLLSQLLPPTQYDVAIPKRFHLGYALKVYWELIPMFVTVCAAMSILVLSIIWATKNKVDVVFTTHSRDNISRMMDLRNPSIHKIIIINQRYEPWPEMQIVLEKMAFAHKRALTRANSCEHP